MFPRSLLLGIFVLGVLGGCTSSIHLRNAKTGETATCGGEMWNPTSSRQDDHCLGYWHGLGYDPVP
ncbi:MAG TPA: hypothetical protein VGP48_02715 [Stellaceae bacterium]|jgi:uncharacterized protein YceK|nr:hypothetical protein [Stellaceae bacterium]